MQEIGNLLLSKVLKANPDMYKSVPDGFKVIYRNEGLRGFTVV